MQETPGRLIAGVFRRQRRHVLLAMLGMTGHQICEALVPVAFGLVIDHAVRTGDVSAMLLSAAGILALFLTLTTAARFGHWMAAHAIQAESHGLRVRIVDRLLRRRPGPADRQTGEQLSIATSDALAAAEIVEVVGWIVAASTGLTVTAVLLIRIDWALGVGILLGVPLLMGVLSLFTPRLERRIAAQQQHVGLAAGTAADLVFGMRPLRGFGGVPEAVRRYRRVSHDSRQAQVASVRASAQFAGTAAFSSGVLLAVVGGIAGTFALEGRLTVGELVTVVGLAAFVSDPVSTITRLIPQLAASRASAVRIAALLGAPEEADRREPQAGRPRLSLVDAHAAGLGGLTVEPADGEIVGVVASSATTAASLTGLVEGSLAPSPGRVEVSGAVLAEPHAVHLFGGTLREALSVGDERGDADLERALAAAALTDLAGEAGGLDLDHALADHGSNLSGGQRQRIALARALLADRPLLLLRDPTSAVDAVTEAGIAQGIRAFRARPGRITLLLTTSPALLSACDRVVFVDPAGRPDVSTHAALVSDPGYAAAVLR